MSQTPSATYRFAGQIAGDLAEMTMTPTIDQNGTAEGVCIVPIDEDNARVIVNTVNRVVAQSELKAIRGALTPFYRLSLDLPGMTMVGVFRKG